MNLDDISESLWVSFAFINCGQESAHFFAHHNHYDYLIGTMMDGNVGALILVGFLLQDCKIHNVRKELYRKIMEHVTLDDGIPALVTGYAFSKDLFSRDRHMTYLAMQVYLKSYDVGFSMDERIHRIKSVLHLHPDTEMAKQVLQSVII